MRIGDVGTVSHIGDLLAFSLAVMLVMSLIYQVEVRNTDENDTDRVDWQNILISIKGWAGFDPNDDGVLELDGIIERIIGMEIPFPLNQKVIVSFIFQENKVQLNFVDGSMQSSPIVPSEEIFVHGCSVLVRSDGPIFPCLMKIAIIGGME
jgi:hypothetical protein